MQRQGCESCQRGNPAALSIRGVCHRKTSVERTDVVCIQVVTFEAGVNPLKIVRESNAVPYNFFSEK